jgi:outer membrane protein TolC
MTEYRVKPYVIICFFLFWRRSLSIVKRRFKGIWDMAFRIVLACARLSICFLISGQVRAVGLPDFLSQVQSRHKGLRAFQLAKEISEDKRVSGDMGLVPTLQLKAQSLRDERAPSMNGATAALSTIYSLGFNQKFATGTVFGMSVQTGSFENQNISPAFASTFGNYVAGGLNFSVSQSLWKDAFGRASRLRRSRESLVSQVEIFTAEYQIRRVLIEAERAYWDLIYSQEELELRRANLARAQKIEAWVARRHSDGIADQADWLNAKALVASRRLQLLNSADDFKAAQQKVKDLLELSDSEAIPQVEGSLRQPRAADFYIGGMDGLPRRGGTIASLEALNKRGEAQIKGIVALEVEEGVKSDLVLAASYGSNPYQANGTLDYPLNNLVVFGKPTAAVSLAWVYLFDGEVKSAQQSQARKEALSSTLSSDRVAIESASQWKEYQRRHSELSQKILAADEISRLHRERAKAEQDKFSKGRSITQAVITAEQDAAEAETAVTKLKAEQRKFETQGRLFVSLEESK